MFENYRPGVQVGNHNCDCHSNEIIKPQHSGPVNIEKDEFGNINRLQWAPDARFTINLTSDTNLPIVSGSQILRVSGITPMSISGWEGLLAYNIVDFKCWKYSNDNWIELPEIETCSSSDAIITFSNDNAVTRVSIKNFRGESIFSDDNKGNIVPLTFDDILAKVLLQGFYYVDIYQLIDNNSRLVRRIPLSIGHSNASNKPTFPDNNHCHTNNAGFATDNTLSLRNGILSVNVSNNCQMGGDLPISSAAVFEYAQPRNLVVELDLNNRTASIGASDIYNYILYGANVFCLLDGVYLEFNDGNSSLVTFKKIMLDNNVLTSYLIIIDSIGKIVEYQKTTSPINSSVDIDNFKESLTQQMTSLNNKHNEDIQGMDDSIANMQSSIFNMKNQIGDLNVSEKITELYNNHNSVNVRLNEINTTLDSKISESQVSEIVNQKVTEEVSPEKLEELVNKAVGENIILDGGVVE